MTYREFMNPQNQAKYMPIISTKAGRMRLDLETTQEIPIEVQNLIYEQFLEEDLSFITLNYTFCLIWLVLNKRKVIHSEWDDLALACLYISTKINEYEYKTFNQLGIDNPAAILAWEYDIITKILKFKLPVPLMITKETKLYLDYLDLIYRRNIKTHPAMYHQFFLIQMISSLTYTRKNLITQEGQDLIDLILSIFFIEKKQSNLRPKLTKLIENSQLYWIRPELLKYLRLH